MNDSEQHNALMFCSYDVGSAEKIILTYQSIRRHAVAQLVEVLRYKPKGRGFDS